MHITIDLTPEEEACLHAIAVREGQDSATAATTLLRHALHQEKPQDVPLTLPETESVYDALKDFIGKFDSRQVQPEETVQPSNDPEERAFGEIVAEKYRKQGFKV